MEWGDKFVYCHVKGVIQYGDSHEPSEWKNRELMVRHPELKDELMGDFAADRRYYDNPPAGIDSINWRAFFAVLYQHDYDGYLAIEPHSMTWQGEKARRALSTPLSTFATLCCNFSLINADGHRAFGVRLFLMQRKNAARRLPFRTHVKLLTLVLFIELHVAEVEKHIDGDFDEVQAIEDPAQNEDRAALADDKELDALHHNAGDVASQMKISNCRLLPLAVLDFTDL